MDQRNGQGSEETLLNDIVNALKPYPMQALSKLKADLIAKGLEVFDFGTGDPPIPLAPEINQYIAEHLPTVPRYPPDTGTPDYIAACREYLTRRFGISDDLGVLPTRGSKDGIFHIALSVVGRAGKRTIAYPDPGYPVYRSSTLFARGNPYPVLLGSENSYQMRPWDWPTYITSDLAAVWVNYPHNPSGAVVDDVYWETLLEWCHRHDCLLLSDDCYVDLYRALPPKTPLMWTAKNVLAFFTLSKRSGFTAYRCGFMAGDPEIIRGHLRASGNFGTANLEVIQGAGAIAWRDDTHVEKRRKIFDERISVAAAKLRTMGFKFDEPTAAFYLWLPTQGDDVQFAQKLSAGGVIVTPASWLGENVQGYVRLALVPELDQMSRGLDKMGDLLSG